MAQEVELKLSLSPHHVESLQQQPLFRSAQISSQGTQVLRNTYYDTPDLKLTQHRVALRIRKKQGKFIQTLKTQGSSDAGLHIRNEWEWLVAEEKLQLELIDPTAWPEQLEREPLQDQLQPIFTTDFRRSLWLLDSSDDAGNPIKVEIALDQGEVRFQSSDGSIDTDPICELELELLTGDPAQLSKMALELAQHVPLLVNDVSKAARGYRLHNRDNYKLRTLKKSYTPQITQEELFSALLAEQLYKWSNYLEFWQFSNEWRYVTEALESLRNICALYENFSHIIPAEPDGEIDRLLTRLIRQLRDIDAWQRTAQLSGLTESDWIDALHQKANARMSVLLQTTEPGLLALLISNQLSEKSWRHRWSGAHQQQALKTLAES